MLTLNIVVLFSFCTCIGYDRVVKIIYLPFTESTNNDKRDTMSPILRCNISKSGSFSSDTRDFFDDEIADQPALMFSGPPSESCNADDIDDTIFRHGNHSSSNKKCNFIRFIIF